MHADRKAGERRSALSLALLLGCCLNACSDGTSQPSTPQASQARPAASAVAAGSAIPGDAGRPSAPPQPWDLVARPTEAHLYVDLSMSMQGFVRDTGSPLHDAVSYLKDFLLREGVTSLKASGFGGTVAPLRALGGPTDTLRWPANQPNTCLALPLRAELNQEAAGALAITMVLTDGVASADTASCGGDCALGSDVACVAGTLADLAKRRARGLWVVGLRVPFAGTYYGETKNTKFRVAEAKRPIYLWIASPSLRTGRSLLQAYERWARQASIEVLAFEVWPGRWDGFRTEPRRRWSAQDFSAAWFRDLRALEDTANLAKLEPEAYPPRLTVTAGGDSRPTLSIRIPLRSVEGESTAPSNSLVAAVGMVLPAADPQAMAGRETPECAESNPDHIRVTGGTLTGQCLRRDSGGTVLYASLTIAAPRAVLWASWTTRVLDSSFLSGWDTRDDSLEKDVVRTLNLSRLWQLTADLLRRDLEIGEGTALLEVTVSDKEAGLPR